VLEALIRAGGGRLSGDLQFFVYKKKGALINQCAGPGCRILGVADRLDLEFRWPSGPNSCSKGAPLAVLETLRRRGARGARELGRALADFHNDERQRGQRFGHSLTCSKTHKNRLFAAYLRP
jgi:hypothetical protein